MGGTNPETILGMRLHISGGDVHIHDDAKSMKFSMDQSKFKKELEDSIDELTSSDGIITIEGKTKDQLCVGKKDRKFFMFLMDGGCVKSKLLDFIKGC